MNECIVWEQAFDKKGYGVKFYKGKTMGAHRYKWIITNGDIPKGMFVCHKCDNPKCVNIDHLFLGTAMDNMRDKMTKNRHRFGNPTKVFDGKKPCNICKDIKPLSEFSPSGKSKRTGIIIYRPACKKCRCV